MKSGAPRAALPTAGAPQANDIHRKNENATAPKIMSFRAKRGNLRRNVTIGSKPAWRNGQDRSLRGYLGFFALSLLQGLKHWLAFPSSGGRWHLRKQMTDEGPAEGSLVVHIDYLTFFIRCANATSPFGFAASWR